MVTDQVIGDRLLTRLLSEGEGVGDNRLFLINLGGVRRFSKWQ